ncbi:hypothetical protein LY76DRAFT_32353 [Colletotrichum caudatum]|nr:hypothetical protein LY76DRAFT_32353 [Colletotrichum caudatum]
MGLNRSAERDLSWSSPSLDGFTHYSKPVNFSLPKTCSPLGFLTPSSCQPDASRLRMSAPLMHAIWVGELTGVAPRALSAVGSVVCCSRLKHHGRPRGWTSGMVLLLLGLSWKGSNGYCSGMSLTNLFVSKFTSLFWNPDVKLALSDAQQGNQAGLVLNQAIQANRVLWKLLLRSSVFTMAR